MQASRSDHFCAPLELRCTDSLQYRSVMRLREGNKQMIVAVADARVNALEGDASWCTRMRDRSSSLHSWSLESVPYFYLAS